jgi:thiamine phosphate synthase YjbQ (UPF0047 family)
MLSTNLYACAYSYQSGVVEDSNWHLEASLTMTSTAAPVRPTLMKDLGVWTQIATGTTTLSQIKKERTMS